MIPLDFDTLSLDDLEKKLIEFNATATALYRFDEDEQANEYADAAYKVYLAIQKKKGIAVHDPMTKEDIRRIMESK